MSCPDGTKWLVAVLDSVLSNDGLKDGRCHIINLKDPSTQESRQYIFANDKDIVEVQNLPADFSSYIVGRHVIKDGNLYVLNRVDPLFWVLALFPSTAENQKSQWQPFAQIVDSLPREVRTSLIEDQICHLCQVLTADQTGDVPYYKFNHEKALVWLKKKQDILDRGREIGEGVFKLSGQQWVAMWEDMERTALAIVIITTEGFFIVAFPAKVCGFNVFGRH